MSADWISYHDAPPAEAGIYEWRMPSKKCVGLVIGVFAHHRRRGAGRRDVLSPSFDHWNGWEVRVPAALQWRQPTSAPDIKPHQERLSFVEGVSLEACPFCHRVPTFHAYQTGSGGGVVICGAPEDWNHWWTACCGWAGKRYFDDPRKLAEARTAALNPVATQ